MRHQTRIAALLVGVLASPLAAQQGPGRLELAANAGYFTVSDWSFLGAKVENAWGYQFALRYRVWRPLLIELGGHMSDHPVTPPVPPSGSSGGASAAPRLSVRAAYVQATVRLGSAAARVGPFLGIRGGPLFYGAGTPGNWDQGRAYGGVVGLHVRVWRWIALEALGSYTHIELKRTAAFTLFSIPSRANSFGFQGGVALHVPWFGR